MKAYLHRYFSLFSGIALAASFTFSGWNLLCFAALIPMMTRILGCQTSGELRRETLLFSYGYYMPLLSWIYGIYDMLPFSDGVNAFLLVLLTAILPALFGLIMFAATAVFVRVKQSDLWDSFRYALLFTFGEFLLEIVPGFSFPWGRVGTITAVFTPFIQSASLFGGLFLSFLVLFVNGGAAYLIVNRKRINREMISGSVLIICIISLNISYGYLRINRYDYSAEKKTEVVLVQGNFSGRRKWVSSPDSMTEKYISLSELAKTDKTRLIVFPETAIAGFLDNDEYLTVGLRKLARNSGSVLVTGINCRVSGERYNSAAAFEPDGTVSEPYFKQRLVPFGEYLPLVPDSAVDGYSGYSAGMVSFPIDTSAGCVGTVICYESVYPNISRKTVRNGAELLAVITNDSWFDNTRALEQHLAHSVMRAVENDRWVVRAANTAVTAVISPTGEITAEAPPYVPCALRSQAGLKAGLSVYGIFGDIIIIPALWLIACGLGEKKRSENVVP